MTPRRRQCLSSLRMECYDTSPQKRTIYQGMSAIIEIRGNTYTLFSISKTFRRYRINIRISNELILTREGKIKECK